MTALAQVLAAEQTASARFAARVGFPLAIMLALMAAVGFVLGIFTPPRSGPFCTLDCTAYPYHPDAARFFPRDYWWMLPGVTLAPLVLTMAACVHFSIAPARRLFSLLAVCFATIATAFITLDYFVQVLVVQPAMVHGEGDGIAMLTQYNPHGLFILLEDLGYLLLAKTFLSLAMALPVGKSCRTLRWTLGVVSVLALVSFVGLAARYGIEMALPFELAVITVVWIGLIPIGILLARRFWSMQRESHAG
jgi:hypothetical protein